MLPFDENYNIMRWNKTMIRNDYHSNIHSTFFIFLLHGLIMTLLILFGTSFFCEHTLTTRFVCKAMTSILKRSLPVLLDIKVLSRNSNLSYVQKCTHNKLFYEKYATTFMWSWLIHVVLKKIHKNFKKVKQIVEILWRNKK